MKEIDLIFKGDNVSSFIKAEKQIKLIENATLNDYNTYLGALKNNGFALYADNKIGDNLFATFRSETATVTVYFIKSEAKIRIIAEPCGYLYPRKEENVYTPIEKPNLLTAIKGDISLEESSMSYVIRLDDGSFIVIDGGLGTGPDADNLMDMLKSQSKDSEKPVISAWIFTHCHDDHIGNFNVFSQKYHDSIELERIYYNFQTDEDILQGNGKFMLDDSNEKYKFIRYNNFKKVLQTYYPCVPKITPHTGDKYCIKNAVMDVLYTYEDELPEQVKTINNSSIVFKLSIQGQSMIITGDIESKAILDRIVERYGDFVKCDFVQAPHHGLTNHVPFYQYVNPTYFLLPINHQGFNSVLDNENYNPANFWLAHVSEKMRHVVTTGNGTVSIPLPFNPSEDEAVKAPKWSTVFKDYSHLY